MYLLDSSVWIALFLDFDSLHEKSKEIFSGLNNPVYIPYNVIVEVTMVLTYKHSKQQADNFLSFIENEPNYIIIENLPQ